MPDQILGYLLLGVAVLAVAAIVASAARVREQPPLRPPPGVHVPPGSWLPVIWAVGGALLGAGLAFKPDDQPAAWWFLIPGLGVFVVGAIISVRTAAREWEDTEKGSHDEGSGHH
ncbi:MAG: hypothetical protein ACRDFZ_04280 [Candidatus Limnocylindria bacterium]